MREKKPKRIHRVRRTVFSLAIKLRGRDVFA